MWAAEVADGGEMLPVVIRNVNGASGRITTRLVVITFVISNIHFQPSTPTPLLISPQPSFLTFIKP